ncbi:MAG: hypothetical protein RMX96_12345 [Nostoc sp. ChiSLP02]|nr:hypothetical protein [Nostoc sp. DedSLP05]MDZ8103389.1 hypothetical protein [Nostoc sp. DedSLP01]MDZ8185632.1 hypothetical protein [Nostoc sp. ChiSLP02]
MSKNISLKLKAIADTCSLLNILALLNFNQLLLSATLRLCVS